jgi:hypothetical protein
MTYTNCDNDEALSSLRALVKAVGELPENGAGTIQGHDLNQAYMYACTLLERHASQLAQPMKDPKDPPAPPPPEPYPLEDEDCY